MAPRQLTPRGTQRRRDLMEAASRLFGDQGYHRTTVGDVCAALGVGKGVFYWYFDSKETLFRELLLRSLLQLRRAQHVALEGSQSPVERIERGARASIDFFRANPRFLTLIRIAAQYEEFSGYVRAGQATVVADTAAHIREGIDDGSLRPGDAELMAHGILGAIFHFVETYLRADAGPMTARPELADEVVAFCLKGVLAPPAQGTAG